ncbi:hypothetical protein AVEN_36915-1 [Araneus ventricosus]|uniref:Uncharacterized protein n=1 Tax=Araneus ventricosus TaxID=182803 RepID=A0A4Y2G6I2_ARAVE|nr:hypothetical protein AVEN_36915-1 [Araneus ventricosus]
MVDKQEHGLEEGGGLLTASESSKSSDILYSKASSSDKEELISASASDSRDYKTVTVFSNRGRTAIGVNRIGESFFSLFLFETSLKSVKSGEAKASSLTGKTDGEEEIGKLVIGGDALAIESGDLELEIEITGLV